MAKKKLSLKTVGQFLDEKILLLLSLFLIAFIPLYPKIPLFDAIPGYIVRVRVEDILVGFSCLVYFIQLWRKKIKLETKVSKWIFAYIVVAFLSILSGLLVIKTIPMEMLHLGKSLLHFFRYIEYFSLFFILYSSVKSEKDLKLVLYALTFTILGVAFYGYGQKFWYWPVFSTMNREFSKGMVLYLTEHARVQSTFAGHYDLAAFLVIVLPIFYTLRNTSKNKWQKRLFGLTHLAGLWLLVASAARISFASYLLAVLVAIILLAWQEQKFGQKILSLFKRGLLFTLLVSIMMFAFGDDMRERFLQILRGYPEAYQVYEVAEDFTEDSERWLVNRYNDLTNFKEWGKPKPPDNGIAFDNTNEFENVLTPTDQQPSTTKPIDVYVDVPNQVLVATESGEMVYVEQERTWSDNALKYGLSLAIRLDELWPNALRGFMKNPVLGSAYATLNKKEFYQFTEAESTDNNFLRTLGETGLLGFISFYGIFIVMLKQIKKNKSASALTKSLNLAFIAASIGLLANALYIDVFASSKVAFSYWALAGTILAINQLKNHDTQKKPIKKS